MNEELSRWSLVDILQELTGAIKALKTTVDSLVLLANSLEPWVDTTEEDCTCGPEHHTGGFCRLHGGGLVKERM